jgi:hypothetical protein
MRYSGQWHLSASRIVAFDAGGRSAVAVANTAIVR